ncbi:MAG: (2Fe-2S) ferredoxin domain-containing protein [Thiobacillaceae bacterium]|nr:(2Fe-2S) ferredoxin domain-containing protein [Thiobacillaceae bacterium]MDW8324007.1 (2Fe-2S) ferredoxin domain-containing protein [Burkholderiales bacterium]
MSHYRHHLFFCLNVREDGGACCSQHDAERLFEYAKRKAKAMGLHGKGGDCRINRAGCFDRCDLGPVIVVYPDAVWYTYVDEHDIDEILESHLRDGRVVDRLKLD